MQHPAKIGKYEVEEYLGGGMSRVYRARDPQLDRRVAVKVLSEAASASADAKARFLQEARLASGISHVNIISVLDFGEVDGLPFMVMELLEGESLRQAIDQGHSGNFGQRMRTALQLGRALQHIHERKIVHRDIKPDNVNIDRAGAVKLMDFGIAKTQDVQLTRVGFTLGTPFYMAPEQIRGQSVTPQTDVYSFGVLLYELLSGVKPFSGANYDKVFEQSLNQPPDLTQLRAAHVPAAAIDLIQHSLAKLAAQRPQSMDTVCSEIERIIRSAQTVAAPAAGVPLKAQPRPNPARDLPLFLRALPSLLQTQAGLMLFATLVMLVIGGAVGIILHVMGVL